MRWILQQLFLTAAMILTLCTVNVLPQATNDKATTTREKNNERQGEAVASLISENLNVPNSVPSDPKTVISLERIGVLSIQPVTLTVEEAIRLALENNNDIRATETDVRIAEFNLRSAQGVFDPVFQSDNYFERTVMPTASTLEGGADGKLIQRGFTSNFQFRGAIPRFGGTLQSDFNNSRTSTNAQFNSLNPQYPTTFSLSLIQPLWRGVRTDENRRRIDVAKKNVTLSDTQFRQRTIEIIEQTEAAYWDLAFALKNLQVQRDAVAAAQEQLDSNRRQVDQGVLAPIDAVQAETQIANFKQNLFAAQEQITVAENNLKRLTLPDRNHPFWTQAVIPVSEANLIPPRMSLPDAIKSAYENRPEIKRQETNAQINQINTRFLRDQTKPRVDLIASYRAEGLAGSEVPNNEGLGSLLSGDPVLRDRVNELSSRAGLPPLPVVPPSNFNQLPDNLIGGYGRSLSNLFSQNYPTFRVGVRVEIPFGNRTAKAELGRSLAEGTRIYYERKQAEQNIEVEVRNALQAVASSEARLTAAREARVAAEKQYESERRQFTTGTSTVFLVLERQTGLVNAQGREIEAQTLLNKNIANLRRVTGGALDRFGITLQISKPR